MDAPSTGWVTVLAGLLARGSLPSCVRPSQLPSGRLDASSPLTVAGAATDFCKASSFRVPSFVPGLLTRGTSTVKFPPPEIQVKSSAERSVTKGPPWRSLSCAKFIPAADYSRFAICFSCVMAIRRIVCASSAPMKKGPAMTMTLALRTPWHFRRRRFAGSRDRHEAAHAYAMGTDNPPPPTDDGKKDKKKKKDDKQRDRTTSSRSTPTRNSCDDYRAAREMILAGHYEAASPRCTRSATTSIPTSPITSATPIASSATTTVEDLVRGGARRRPEPCAHLVLLRHVADGAGQPPESARRPAEGQADLRQYRRARNTASSRP